MESAFVTLARFRNLLPAQYYKILLQENGVNAFLPEEHTVGLCSPDFWFIQLNARLRLQVPNEEAERAAGILREAAECARTTEEFPLGEYELFHEEVREAPADLTGPRWFLLSAAIWLFIALTTLGVTALAKAL